MWFNNRVYFITDRDGTMNIWSMKDSGGDLQQHTEHKKWDVRYAKLHNGNIVYQVGADLWHYNVESDVQKKIDIRVVSDLDQLRKKWDDKPSQHITSAHPDQSGDHIAVTARGRVLSPLRKVRIMEISPKGPFPDIMTFWSGLSICFSSKRRTYSGAYRAP
ncbi:MAG: tricorn protease [Saprospiraceae bacterium]|jgi:tricorn protease